jgi:hypothetical protein
VETILSFVKTVLGLVWAVMVVLAFGIVPSVLPGTLVVSLPGSSGQGSWESLHSSVTKTVLHVSHRKLSPRSSDSGWSQS